jgi:actin-related protein
MLTWFVRYLLIDSKPRRMALVLPPALPLPLLATILDLLFNRFQSPLVSLLSSGAMAAVAAGVRSALVVDLGWTETVVSSVYEYREVRCTRSVRGGKLLVERVHDMLKMLVRSTAGGQDNERHTVSLEECEEIVTRLMWCRKSSKPSASPSPRDSGLPTVEEQDEVEHDRQPEHLRVHLKSTRPRTTIEISFAELAEACEAVYFENRVGAPFTFDDEELPAHWLVYQHLLKLPVDVRAVCMSRVIFTGGCSRIPGLRSRIFDEVSRLVVMRGWNPVSGKAVEELSNNASLRRHGSKQTSHVTAGNVQAHLEQDSVWHDAANADPDTNAIDMQLDREKSRTPTALQGQLRALQSLGAWSGASLTCQLKVTAIATVDRDAWLLNGINGASKPAEVDLKAQQRQSMGPGLMRAATGMGERSWTLGVWGAL